MGTRRWATLSYKMPLFFLDFFLGPGCPVETVRGGPGGRDPLATPKYITRDAGEHRRDLLAQGKNQEKTEAFLRTGWGNGGYLFF